LPPRCRARLKNLLGKQRRRFQRLYDLFGFIAGQRLEREIVKVMLPVVFANPNMDFQSVLTTVELSFQGSPEALRMVVHSVPSIISYFFATDCTP
jgi:hypothetical protein